MSVWLSVSKAMCFCFTEPCGNVYNGDEVTGTLLAMWIKLEGIWTHTCSLTVITTLCGMRPCPAISETVYSLWKIINTSVTLDQTPREISIQRVMMPRKLSICMHFALASWHDQKLGDQIVEFSVKANAEIHYVESNMEELPCQIMRCRF